jgi:peptide/nickel transport system permease protein
MIMRHIRSITALCLAVLFGSGLVAEFLCPYAPGHQHRDLAFTPPTPVHLTDDTHQIVRPFVYGIIESPAGSGRYVEDRRYKYIIRFFTKGDSYQIARIRSSTHLFGADSGGQVFFMGTDEFGRDLLSNMLYGIRQSLLISLTAAVLTLFLGLALGGFAGYFGGWTDEVLMGTADLFLCIPWLYLLFGVRAALPLRLDYPQAILTLLVTLPLAGWARPARLVRSIVLSARERDYVRSARAFGASDWYLLTRHVLPEAWHVLAVQATLLIPGYILAETTLSFLGLGINEPNVSWGSLIVPLGHYDVMVSYWWMWLPAVFLTGITALFYATAAAFGQLRQ